MSSFNRERQRKGVSRRNFVKASAGAGLVALGSPTLHADNSKSHCANTKQVILNGTMSQIFGEFGTATPFASLLDAAQDRVSTNAEKLAIKDLKNAINAGDNGQAKPGRIAIRDFYTIGVDDLGNGGNIKTELGNAASHFCVPMRSLPTSKEYFASCKRLLDGWEVQLPDLPDGTSQDPDKVPGLIDVYGSVSLKSILESQMDFSTKPMLMLWKSHLMRVARILGLLGEGHNHAGYATSQNFKASGPGTCAYFNGTEFVCIPGEQNDKCNVLGGVVSSGTTFCDP